MPRASASSNPTTARRTCSFTSRPSNAPGLATLSENQKVSFELERGANGKVSATKLSAL